MSILDRLATALGRNDQRPNVELAEALVARPDSRAIAILADALSAGPIAVQNDALKVLYEVGARAPQLVAPHAAAFFALLGSRNNRNVWGALQAIDTITSIRTDEVAAQLGSILAAADRGSVIAKDRLMSILSQLARHGDARAFPALLDRLETAAPNQFPTYAEVAASAVTPGHKARLTAIIEARLRQITLPAKRARVEKVLRKLSKP